MPSLGAVNYTKSPTVRHEALAQIQIIYVSNVLQAHSICQSLVQKSINELLFAHILVIFFSFAFYENIRNSHKAIDLVL